jgi:hypothetical protein
MVGCPHDAVGVLSIKTERMPARGFYPYCAEHRDEWKRLYPRSTQRCRVSWRETGVVGS